MTKNFQRTLSDIDFILSNINEDMKNKLPIELRNIIHENKLNGYDSKIDSNIPIEEQRLHPDTVDFLSMLYLNYWCDNEDEKELLKQKFEENEIKNREKYSTDNLFKNNLNKLLVENVSTNYPIVLSEKESIFIKIKNFILKIFNINK